MRTSSTYFAPERYGPDRMLLEAFLKDSEEEWMRIIRERKNEIIGLPVCFLICILKRWTATLNMMAKFQRLSFAFSYTYYWRRSILYQYIRNDILIANVEKWPRLTFLSLLLIVASYDGYTEGVKVLLRIGAFPNSTNHFYGSALFEAVFSRNIKTVRALRSGGATDYFVKGYGMTAAARAAQLGELQIMQEIGWSKNDSIVLECGVRGGNIEVVKAILAVRTKKFDLERVSRFIKNGFLRKLLSETNATLPEKAPISTVLHCRWFSAKSGESKAVSKKLT